MSELDDTAKAATDGTAAGGNKLAAFAARGAGLLDRRRPGWHNKVNLTTLDAGSALTDVVRQVCYKAGANWHALATQLMVEEFGPDWRIGCNSHDSALGPQSLVVHGFDAPTGHNDPHQRRRDNRLLTHYWAEQVLTRRQADNNPAEPAASLRRAMNPPKPPAPDSITAKHAAVVQLRLGELHDRLAQVVADAEPELQIGLARIYDAVVAPKLKGLIDALAEAAGPAIILRSNRERGEKTELLRDLEARVAGLRAELGLDSLNPEEAARLASLLRGQLDAKSDGPKDPSRPDVPGPEAVRRGFTVGHLVIDNPTLVSRLPGAAPQEE